MPRVQKLIPVANYKKPLFKPQGDDIWILERLEQAKTTAEKDLARRKEELADELNMPGLSRKAAKAVKAAMGDLRQESVNVRKLNELLKLQKAQAYEDQLRHAGF